MSDQTIIEFISACPHERMGTDGKCLNCGQGCTCFHTDEKYHYVYYGITEPGSAYEQNPLCALHGDHKQQCEHGVPLVSVIGGPRNYCAECEKREKEMLAEITDDDFEMLHLRLSDGRCVISMNGQGHLPCSEHPPIYEGY